MLGVAAGVAAWLASAAPARATVPTDFIDEAIVGDLDEPVGLAFLPDGRLLFIEGRTAKVRMVVGGQIATTDPVLVVPDVEADDQEESLAGLAVDPGWPQRPYIYVQYNYLQTANLRISRFTCFGDLDSPGGNSLTASPASRYDILTDIPDNTPNHNGGTLRFGPDGMLYSSIGEDYDHCAAQSRDSLLGRILRLDVSGLPAGPGGPPAKNSITPAGNPFSGPSDNARLTYALGLRNPFRFQVDRLNGQLFVSDVGSIVYEEIDWVNAAGLNFGWPYLEGPAPGLVASCPGIPPASYTAPIVAFDRSAETGAASIISASLYRSPAVPTAATFPPSYEGNYFYADYYHGYLRRIQFSGGSWGPAAPVPGQPSTANWGDGFDTAADFQEAADGSLWYVRQFFGWAPQTGSIHRIRYTGAAVGIRPPGGTVPARLSLSPPRPNPSSGPVTATLQLGRAAAVEVVVRDLLGRHVRTLLAGSTLPAGEHAAAWDGRDASARPVRSGVYLIEATAGGERASGRVAVVR